MSKKKRYCKECGGDISNRHHKSIRCKKCQDKHDKLISKTTSEKYRKQHIKGRYILDKDGDVITSKSATTKKRRELWDIAVSQNDKQYIQGMITSERKTFRKPVKTKEDWYHNEEVRTRIKILEDAYEYLDMDISKETLKINDWYKENFEGISADDLFKKLQDANHKIGKLREKIIEDYPEIYEKNLEELSEEELKILKEMGKAYEEYNNIQTGFKVKTKRLYRHKPKN